MPAQPLIDLESLDLSKIVVSPEEIGTKCKQRGRLALLDGINHVDMDEGLLVGFKEIQLGQWWCDDHIPGRPIFPGVLMIEGAAQLCTYHFLVSQTELDDPFVGFAGVDDVRFRGVVEPGVRLTWVGKVVRVRRSMFTYQSQGYVEGKMVFEAKVMGVVL